MLFIRAAGTSIFEHDENRSLTASALPWDSSIMTLLTHDLYHFSLFLNGVRRATSSRRRRRAAGAAPQRGCWRRHRSRQVRAKDVDRVIKVLLAATDLTTITLELAT